MYETCHNWKQNVLHSIAVVNKMQFSQAQLILTGVGQRNWS